MITPAELATLADKSSKDPEVVRLYQEHEFLTAYAMHTDQRVRRGPHDAIGGLWEEYGGLQAEFLKAQGLKPFHTLLDIGCGSGRLARKIVPYLHGSAYIGVDISREALIYARGLGLEEGWASRMPRFVLGMENVPAARSFNFLWAFSVMIHLPTEHIRELFGQAVRHISGASRFYFSYVPTERTKRSGLKQWKHPRSFFVDVAGENGLAVSDVPEWSGRQSILCATLGPATAEAA